MNNSTQINKKEYVISDELEKFGEDTISEKQMTIIPAKIKYVLVYPAINKKTAGRCMLSNPMTKLFGKCDYIIQMSGDLWDQLDETRRKILMWHELLHVFPVENSKTGEFNFRLRDHDVKDFYTIIKECGIDWFQDIKTMFSSVYDIDPAQLEGFGL